MSLAVRASSELRYKVVSALARGGMAEIFLAKTMGPGGFERPVVIKRLLPHLRSDQSHVRMFLDEARIVAGIRHPNVVDVHDLQQIGDDYILVMEYLEGEATSTYRDAARKADGLDPWLGAYIVSEAAAGLYAAHSMKTSSGRDQNIVHRDVSPQNIFVTYEGEVKLLDFGVARAEERMSETMSGVVKGKFAYMAPEQLRGKHVDHRSDLFSLGAVLYELTTGHKLFGRDNQAATLMAVCQEPVARPSERWPDYPVGLEPIVMRALQRDPNMRYQSADEMREDIVAALNANGPGARLSRTLRSVMHEMFADRMKRKAELLAESHGEAATVSERFQRSYNDELDSTLMRAHRTPSHIREFVRPLPPKPKRRMLIIFVAAALVTGAIGILLNHSVQDEHASPQATERADLVFETNALEEPVRNNGSAKGTPNAASIDADPMVDFDIATDPAGARVWVGNESTACVAPCRIKVSRGTAPVSVVAKLRGYRDRELTLSPHRDRDVMVTMGVVRPRPSASATRTRRPTRNVRPPEPETPSSMFLPEPEPSEPESSSDSPFHAFE